MKKRDKRVDAFTAARKARDEEKQRQVQERLKEEKRQRLEAAKQYKAPEWSNSDVSLERM